MTCPLGTHKSLLMTFRHSQKHSFGESSSLFSQWLCMVSREKGRQQRQPRMPEPHRLTHFSQETHHSSFSFPVNTSICINPENPSHNVTSKAAGPITSSQFMGKASVIYAPKTTSSKHFSLRNFVPSKCLQLEQCKEKHSCSSRTWKSEQNTSVENQNYHTVRGVTYTLNRPYMLSRMLWIPCPMVQSCYGLLTAQACSVHRRVPQWATLEGCLSAQNEARCRDQLQSNTVLYEQKPAKKWAAVLVCLCMVGGEPAFLFTLRSSKLRGRHKGDVSFAGGKRDAMDRNVVDTALREACEELGISVTENEVWGLLRPLRDKSGMLIAPVLANLGPLESLKFHPNPSEVEEIFTLTVAHLCNPQNRGYTHFRTGDCYGYTLPVFHNDKHRIWGLTAVALDHTLKVIMPV
uniref:Nudix hydrolase domain-containing protein n=2 Tax=Electrophorus electricus TaxID=8005 RepID=A0A4W4HJT5_ELEEL